MWDENADPFTAAVKITVSRLRAKLGDPPLIDTVPRSGYRIGSVMNPRRLPALALHAQRPRSTVRLRLTLWYSGLFLVSWSRRPAGHHLRPGRPGLRRQHRWKRPLPRASRAVLSVPRYRPAAGTRHGAAGVRLRAAPASQPVRGGAGPDGGALHRAWLVHGRPVPRPLRTITAAAWHRLADSPGDRLALSGPRDELRELGIPSTRCSPGWRHPSVPSASSSPTPRTSCAPRWPASESSARSPWPTLAPLSKQCAPRMSGSWPPASYRAAAAHRGAAHPGAGAGRPGQARAPSTWPP